MEMKKEDIKKEDMILNHGLLLTVFTVIYFIFQQFIYPFVYIILVLIIVTLGDKISKILLTFLKTLVALHFVKVSDA